ncbi:hypothetical protein NN561_019753 [Cricetulus griseus]
MVPPLEPRPRPGPSGLGSRPPAPAAARTLGPAPPRPAPPVAPLTASLTAAVPAGHLDAGHSGCRRFLMVLREAQQQRRLPSEAGTGPSRVETRPGASLKRGADAGAQPVPSRSRNRPLRA